MTALAGQRDALAAALLESTQSMPGCLSYVIATDLGRISLPAGQRSRERVEVLWDV